MCVFSTRSILDAQYAFLWQLYHRKIPLVLSAPSSPTELRFPATVSGPVNQDETLCHLFNQRDSFESDDRATVITLLVFCPTVMSV